jgi:hypothetical protein
MTVREISGTPVHRTASRANHTAGHVRRISVWQLSAVCFAALSTTAAARAAEPDSWTIRIIPAPRYAVAQAAPKRPTSAPAPAPQEPAVVPHQAGATPAANYSPPVPPTEPQGASSGMRIIPGNRYRGMAGRASYSEVYHSIPFSRAEYVAHPSYRSEATLGLMLNQMPYPATGEPAVPQYGYVTPYLWDNTYGTPVSYQIYEGLPLGW